VYISHWNQDGNESAGPRIYCDEDEINIYEWFSPSTKENKSKISQTPYCEILYLFENNYELERDARLSKEGPRSSPSLKNPSLISFANNFDKFLLVNNLKNLF
jgi:hypothetical protein